MYIWVSDRNPNIIRVPTCDCCHLNNSPQTLCRENKHNFFFPFHFSIFPFSLFPTFPIFPCLLAYSSEKLKGSFFPHLERRRSMFQYPQLWEYCNGRVSFGTRAASERALARVMRTIRTDKGVSKIREITQVTFFSQFFQSFILL